MPNIVAFVGGSVSIPVLFTDVVDLEGLELTVQYDETVLTAMSTSFENTELDGMNFNLSVGLEISGEIMVAVYAATNQFFSGSGTLLFINFDVIGQLSESTDLTFTSIEINNISILENSENGSVTLINTGCMEMDACNYNEHAVIDDGSCVFESDCAGECGGSASLDECGVCDGDNSSCTGCMDDTACNYSLTATISGECEYSEVNYDCSGNCNVEVDCDGICGGSATEDVCGICGGSILEIENCVECPESDSEDCAGICGGSLVNDECGVCDGDNSSCTGCMDDTACNYSLTATISGECEYSEVNYDCSGNCNVEVDCDGNCGGSLVNDECGICNGVGFPEGSCDCSGTLPEENHDCNGDELSINGLFSPIEFKLFPNFPNPFNPSTTINYSVATFSTVDISIYSMSGKLIQTLVNSSQQPGQYAVQWNASNFPSGLYFVKLISEDKIAEQKVLLIK